MALSPRKVIQCDQSGKDVRVFASSKDAALCFGSKNPSAISKAIKHGLSAFGYRWRYEGEELAPKSNGTPGKRRGIIAIEQDNGNETLFPSLSEASRKLGIGLTAIESSLQTGCLAKGYRFRYEGESLVESGKGKRHKRKVVAIDDDGNIVAEYDCAYDCAKAYGVIDAAVYWCLSPRHPNAKCKGYRLRYKGN